MKKGIIAVVLPVILIIVFSGCNKANVSNSNSAYTSSSSQTANLVLIENYKFNPSVLIIDVGTTVEWKNNDSVVHTIEFDSFNSGSLARGETYKYTFDTKGTFRYNCGPHPYMIGTVEVK